MSIVPTPYGPVYGGKFGSCEATKGAKKRTTYANSRFIDIFKNESLMIRKKSKRTTM